jgi:hypothetical protein
MEREMKKYAAMGLALAALAWCAGAARASTLEIHVGDHPLLADTPDQKVYVYVSGDTQVEGVLLDCQIADGGPSAGGTISGPTITNLDVVTGTIFEGNNFGNFYGNGYIYPQVAWQSTTTQSGTVLANELLAIVTIDTTSGSFKVGDHWELKLTGTVNGDTSFGKYVAQPVITNGTIRIAPASEVPEPGTLALAAVGAGMLLGRRKARPRPAD